MNLRGLLWKKIKALREKYRVRYPKVRIEKPKHLIIIPKFKDIREVDARYPLIEMFAFAHIKWDDEKKKLIYEVIEPELSEKEKEQFEIIKRGLLEIIDVDFNIVKESGKALEYLEDNVKKVLDDEGIVLKQDSYVKIMYYIFRDFIGFNEIEPLMHDPYIEDIGCDGLNISLFVVHRLFGSLETNIVFRDMDYLNNFVIKLAERCGRYISYAKPLLDGTLPDGSRVQATLARDVTTRGPTFSIRKFKPNPLSPIDLINLKTASSELMAYLWLLIESRASMLICGGVSTGKTTFLNAISMFISPEKKIISIEDTRELNLPHLNWIPAVSRVGYGIPGKGGKLYGEVTLYELLKESFRQNPDYVIVGEVRGEEAYVMFQGMASGHTSLGTIHAGSLEDVIKRLETPPINLSPSLVETLDVVIVMTHAKDISESARRVKEVYEIESVDPNTGNAQSIRTFNWLHRTDSFESNINESYLLKKLSYEKGLTYEQILEEVNTRKSVLEWMSKHNIRNYDEVTKIFNFYSKEPETVKRWVRNDEEPYDKKKKGRIEGKWVSASGLRIIS
ncbi:MAG TPA: secretion system protein E [Candidatus Aenigmarchaeota archaeon]|nr:MAG: secretion system protein E [Candidatus Aenigmarchaeota archaeon]HDD45966.1 secretion system protein E [Candidatus Aenigmarchaeota archaeon]